MKTIYKIPYAMILIIIAVISTILCIFVYNPKDVSEDSYSISSEGNEVPGGGYYNAYSEYIKIRALMRQAMYYEAFAECNQVMGEHILSSDDTELFEGIKNKAFKHCEDILKTSAVYYNASEEVSKINDYIDSSMYNDAMIYCEDALDRYYLSPADSSLINDLYMLAYNRQKAYNPLNYCKEPYFQSEAPKEPPPENEALYELKTNIEQYISRRSGSWGVYVKNLNTNEYLSVNEKQYSPASLIKLFTMAAVFDKIADGSIKADDELKLNLRLMICESSNVACNYLTKRLGQGNTVNGFNTENEVTSKNGFGNTAHKSELVDESGRHVVFTGYNVSSPRDCAGILEKIYRGSLVSAQASAEMLSMLENQTHTWKIPQSLPQGVKTANKTGETSTSEGDAAIVYSDGCDYVICIIGNGNVSSGVETIQTVSRMTYNYFNI